MDKIYSLYKPLQNIIRDCELMDSFNVCWQFANYIYNPRFVLNNIELPNGLKKYNNLYYFQANVIQFAELEFLITEIIAYAGENTPRIQKSLKKINDRIKIRNYIHNIRDYSENLANTPEKIFLELNRKAHQQFPAQIFSIPDLTYKYFYIFSQTNLQQKVEKYYELTIKDIYRGGIFLFYYFQHKFDLKYNTNNSDYGLDEELKNALIKRGVSIKNLSIIIDKFGLPLNELRKIIKKNRNYDNTLLYQLNYSRIYPFIKYGDIIICPIPQNILYEINNGFYYRLVAEKGFNSDEYGEAFKNYLIKVLEKANKSNKYKVHKEVVYGKPEKRTADIIVEDDKSVLLIECKTKRMVIDAKTAFIEASKLEIEIKNITSAVLQLYKQVVDYKNNLYPQIQYNKEKEIFLLVVTLEDWYIGYNDYLYDYFKKNVEQQLISSGLDSTILSKINYDMYSSDEFEHAVQIINLLGIKHYFIRFREEKGFSSFEEYEREHLFLEEFKKLILIPEIE